MRARLAWALALAALLLSPLALAQEEPTDEAAGEEEIEEVTEESLYEDVAGEAYAVFIVAGMVAMALIIGLVLYRQRGMDRKP